MSEDSDQEVVLPTVLSNLTNVIGSDLHNFTSGSSNIQSAALDATKFLFDLALESESTSRPHISDLLSSLSPEEAPITRSQTKALNGKRKRSPPKIAAFDQTPLTSLFVGDAGPEQVWAQLELRAKGVCEMLTKALDGSLMDEDADMRMLNGVDNDEGEDDDDDGGARKKLKFEDFSQEDIESLGLAPDVFKRLVETMEPEEDGEEEIEESEEEDDDGEDFGEEVTSLRDPEALDSPGPSRSPRLSRRSKSSTSFQLDDGFFDLASFNAEAEEAEAKHVSRGRLRSLHEGEDSESDEESVDYFAVVDGDPELDGGADGTEPMYADFFDPLPGMSSKKAPVRAKVGKVRFHEEVKVKKIKAKGKGLPVNIPAYWAEMENGEDVEGFGDGDGLVNGHSDLDPDYEDSEEEEEDDDDDDDDNDGTDEDDDEDEDEDEEGTEEDTEEDDQEDGQKGRQAVERLKDDLFAEDSEEESEEGLTTHQKRMAALKEQIAALEAENVAPKKWTLVGEVSARNRPQNSLLEEDLDFERVMKPTPVVTEEVVQELEEMIKSRILASNYDDVVRRRPLDEKPFLPSKLIHLQDTKSAKSLAEIYEDEYSATQNGGVAGEDRDGKLKKEHEEIERQWEKICVKLDALCNAHFTPKQPKATIVSVGNVAAASLESALPTSQTASSMLAPEEVLAPSSSVPRSRSEMTPAEKRAQRNKERKKQRRTQEQLNKRVDAHSRVKGVKRQKEDALKNLVKTGKGVTVIGKKDKGLLSKRSKSDQGS